ncbi:MAG: hypothetical protein WBD36_09520 [Bacteroidota bacterium]
MKSYHLLFLMICAAVAGCSTVTLRPADFSWPVESALKVDKNGSVQEARYSITLNVKELLYEETKDSVNVAHWTLRMLRDARGLYFVTAETFKNVYVFEQSDGALRMANKIMVSEKGLTSPAFNQRAPNVQLISDNEKPVLLTRDGIRQGGK